MSCKQIDKRDKDATRSAQSLSPPLPLSTSNLNIPQSHKLYVISIFYIWAALNTFCLWPILHHLDNTDIAQFHISFISCHIAAVLMHGSVERLSWTRWCCINENMPEILHFMITDWIMSEMMNWIWNWLHILYILVMKFIGSL